MFPKHRTLSNEISVPDHTNSGGNPQNVTNRVDVIGIQQQINTLNNNKHTENSITQKPKLSEFEAELPHWIETGAVMIINKMKLNEDYWGLLQRNGGMTDDLDTVQEDLKEEVTNDMKQWMSEAVQESIKEAIAEMNPSESILVCDNSNSTSPASDVSSTETSKKSGSSKKKNHQGLDPRFKGSDFDLSKRITTVTGIMKEWYESTPNKLSVRERDLKYRGAWRTTLPRRSSYIKRKIIVHFVLRVSHDMMLPKFEAAEVVEKYRRFRRFDIDDLCVEVRSKIYAEGMSRRIQDYSCDFPFPF